MGGLLMRTSVIGVALAALCTMGAAQARDVVIHAGRLIDGVTATPRTNMSIFVRDDRIVEVRSGFVRPEGAEVIDHSQRTVLPGLIDSHVHLSSGPPEGNPIANQMTRTTADWAYITLPGYRAMLHAGFTTVRNLGGDTRIAVALKRAIDAGRVEGPRMLVSGEPIGPTGGHSDHRNGLDPELDHPRWNDSVADGPDEVRKAVRRLHREGVDILKIHPSGGVLSANDDPKLMLMTEEEIAAAVSTAHMLGMKVAAHAHGTAAINAAARLGVDSIEHATYSDAETFKLMKANGTYFVPTLLVASQFLKIANERPETMHPSSVEKIKYVAPLAVENLRKAYRAGIKIAFGTDTSDGENAKEFALLVNAGIRAEDAILAATRNAAELLGASTDIGSVQAGRYADIIAVDGDPLADISVLERVSFVMKGGAVVKGDGKK
jgi:imidazolonepropionase-like amidohydrolase